MITIDNIAGLTESSRAMPIISLKPMAGRMGLTLSAFRQGYYTWKHSEVIYLTSNKDFMSKLHEISHSDCLKPLITTSLE